MKIVYLLSSVLFSIFVSGVSVVAQSTASMQTPARFAESVFRANEGVIVNPVNPKSAIVNDVLSSESKGVNSMVRRKPPASTNVQPGENPLFVLHSTKQFVRHGESVTYSLVALQNIRQRVCVYGQVLKPGRNLYYDGSYPEGYFYLESGNGGCVSDVNVGNFVKVHTRTINADDLQGTMIINLVITDDEGHLIQQIITDLYIVQGGPYSLTQYVKSWKLVGNTCILTGRFPINVPIYYMIGALDLGYELSGSGIDQGLFSSDGSKLVLPSIPMLSNSASQDFMGWDPVTRQAIIAPNIINQPR